jgi:hypothetical protein
MGAKHCCVGLLVLFALVSSGCVRPNSHFRDVASEILSGNESIDTKIELKIGGVSILLAKTIAGFIDDPDLQEAREYVDFVRQVEVGVYRLESHLERDLIDLERSVIAAMEKWGFEICVKAREDRDLVMVFLQRGSSQSLEDGFVVVVGESEIVLVKAKAEFQNLAQAVMARHGLSVEDWGAEFRG